MISGGEESTTNNRMELMAVISRAARALRRPCVVELYSDSKYVIDALEKGWAWGWKRRGWVKADKTGPQPRPVGHAAGSDPAARDHTTTGSKGHEANEKNNRCDEQAVLESRKFKR